MHRTTPIAAAVVSLTSLLAVAPTAASAAEPAATRAHVQVAPEAAGNVVIELLGHVGIADIFELYRDNDDGDRREVELHASPTVGFAAAVDYKLSDTLAVGIESLFLWVEHEDDGDRRLLVSPHARVRLAFPVAATLTAEGTFGLGMAWWEEDAGDTGNQQLDAIADSRLGVSLRLAAGMSWVLDPMFTTFATVGYTTSITSGEEDDNWNARFGTVLFGLGARAGL